jgi:AraC-like DNA-binding protein
MKKFGNFAPLAGEIGIARLAMVFSGYIDLPNTGPSLVRRIILIDGKRPQVIGQGTIASSYCGEGAIAFLDPRRFSEETVLLLAKRWSGLTAYAGRLEDMINDIDDRPPHRMNERMLLALSLLRAGERTLSVARAVAMSESSMTRWFNRTLGAPAKRWEMWMRLRRSLDDLFDGSSVTQAAAAAGFADASHFSRLCVDAFGVPPIRLARLEIRQFTDSRLCIT